MAFRRARVALVVIVISILLLFWHLPKSSDRNSPQPVGEIVSTPHEVNNDPQTPILGFIPLPDASQKVLPRIQHVFRPESPPAKQIRLARLEEIKAATLHSWRGYERFAWLDDELAPVSGGSKTSFGGWAVTLVDSLDTLWLMGLKTEFEKAVQALEGIDFEKPAHLPINVFETTIRYLGGLLGAYDVSNGKYPILLQKATEVGNMLYAAFDTPSRMPVLRWSKIGVEAPAGDALVAELGTLTLEFTRLTQLTGDLKFYDAVQRISNCFESQQGQTRVPGLFPDVVNARECWFGDGVTFSIGGSADSVYEYFPKEYQLLGGSTQYKQLYFTAREPLKRHLLFNPSTPSTQDLLLAGIYKKYPTGREEFIPETEHLACFAGGMFALGAKLFDLADDLNTARSLVNGCVWAYNATVTGIMPERFRLVPCPDRQQPCTWDDKAWMKELLIQNAQEESARERKSLSEETRAQQLAERLHLPNGIPEISNRGYALRPEAIESIFVLYRITGDESLREAVWNMFKSIVKYTKTEFGFSSIDDVTRTEPGKIDTMESYWTAETLKYLYLLFEDPTIVSLDNFVFNTEAHPFRVRGGE